ncbi:MAG: winged helix-turn-helix transcriptional regulator [Lachnospiraceae bacterium]|nr:winged helix-turn-helix transcriptional regulator [Lachnospiraceae bacterium]
MYDMESIIFTNISKYKKLYEKKLCNTYEKYDLRKIDMEIIIYLANCGNEDTARDIANTNMFTKGHISQSVKRLSDMGYVSIVHDEKDMRVQHLKLTDKVRPMIDEMVQQKSEMEKCVFAGVTEEESETMKRVFEKMCANILKEMEKID